MQRWTALAAVLVFAGCASPPPSPDVPDASTPTTGAPALAILSSVQMQDCQAVEYDFLLDEAAPSNDTLPPGMTIVLRDGRMQAHGVTARCTLDGEPASFTLGAVRVNVTGPLQGPGAHGLLVRVAIDSPALLAAFASWGLWVPEQRAWTIELLDGDADRGFLHADDPADALASPQAGNVLHFTRNELVTVQRAPEPVEAEASRFRWFETASEGDGMVVSMAVDEGRPAVAGTKGAARVEDAQGRATGTGFQGDGVILDAPSWSLSGLLLPAA